MVAAAQPESDAEEPEATEEQETKKARFVWTPELHSRFETAVNRLGVATAKPQAIRKLMGCQTEEEPPTRQNIKSHLQKYRLLVQKQAQHSHRARSPSIAATSSSTRVSNADGASAGNDATPAHAAATSGDSHGGNSTYTTAKTGLEQQQHVSICAQLDLQSQLHARMVAQRRTQQALGSRLARVGGSGSSRVLSREQTQRLAQHVLLQRLMLQHLYSMLHACNADLTSSSSTGQPPSPPSIGASPLGGLDTSAFGAGLSSGLGMGSGLGAAMGSGLGTAFGAGLQGMSDASLGTGHIVHDTSHSLLSDAASLFPSELVDPCGPGENSSMVSSSNGGSNSGNLSNDDASSNADASNEDSKSYDGFGDVIGSESIGSGLEVGNDLQLALHSIDPLQRGLEYLAARGLEQPHASERSQLHVGRTPLQSEALPADPSAARIAL